MHKITKSPKETIELGHFLFKRIGLSGGKNALVIALEGELGAGKTTLVQGIAKLLGIKAKVKSPTFTLIKKYRLPQNSKFKILNSKFLYHLDCYRLKNHKDLLVLGIKDILKDKDNILMIEWPERINKILPKNRIRIKLEHVDTNIRKISISA